MQNNVYRQRMLLQIIEQEAVFSQEQLLEKLQGKGVTTTQATLSRDLKALHIIKVPGVGYRLPPSGQERTAPGADKGLVSIEFSGTNAIIRTLPGFAPAVASHIDKHPSSPVMGTIAGDDTVLLVLRTGHSAQECLDALEKACPGISNLLLA